MVTRPGSTLGRAGTPGAAASGARPDRLLETRLLERFARAVLDPPLMMLYPPVCTGRAYDAEPDGRTLWEGAPAAGTLYVHIPFCETRCGFCPFYAVAAGAGLHRAYVDDVLAEALLYAPAVEHVEFTSVYLGGGTPSVLAPELVARLVGGLRRMLHVRGADVTVEAHPSDVTPQRLAEWCDAGVTRLSIGVQSFDAEVLDACGRGDTARHVRPAVEAALAAPLREVNADLMYGLPEQSFHSWLADLETAAALRIPGLTLYATVYLPAFRSRCRARRLAVPTDADRFEMYELAHAYLTDAGYPQPHFGAGAFLRGALNPHRRNVARGLPTLGLGTWAYSSSGPYAYHNEFPREAWARKVREGRLPIRQLVVIPDHERERKHVIETLLLAYVELDRFREAFGRELAEAFPSELALLERLGLAAVEEGELRLTRSGGRHLREVRYLFASEPVVRALEASEVQSL